MQKFSVAPMMDWTDRHCRYFHRLLSQKAVLYTEMVTADAVIHGHRDNLLGYNGLEHPVILQLGGSDPEKLATAVQIANDYGYDKINLNIGCPSDRVQSGAFGACLMRDPLMVAKLFDSMQNVSKVPVTIKCRIGIDDDDPTQTLPYFIQTVANAGCREFIIHARKAWLKGLSPKENRTIPPLDYNLVYSIKQNNPALHIGINGGINHQSQWTTHLNYVDEVMVGRSAYQTPAILIDVDQQIYGLDNDGFDYDCLIQKMADYCDDQMVQNGIKFHAIIRHMLGLFHGQKNGRLWRRILSEKGCKPNANSEVLMEAYSLVYS